jgi:hypothetical protein
MSDSTVHDDNAVCANCATPLQDEYCAHCGQRAHNPLNSFSHAIEEFAESFWHLDGRAFRTLKELLIPGRIANAYLAGHRAPYLPPLRMLIIFAALAFFVAQFSYNFDFINYTNNLFANDTTVEQVEKHRDTELQQLEQQLDWKQITQKFKLTPHIDANTQHTLDTYKAIEENHIRKSAQDRILRIQGTMANGDQTPATDMTSLVPSGTADAPDNATVSIPTTRTTLLPSFANRWWTARREAVTNNVLLGLKDSKSLTRLLYQFLHSVPTMLFVLVPVFALLLKLFYLRSNRGYLEHLVVALYSHAFLCLVLLVIFLLRIIANQWPVTDHVLSWLRVLLWLWMAVYLWLTQYRVYAQSWFKTTLKYVLLGSVYFCMMSASLYVLMIVSFSSN